MDTKLKGDIAEYSVMIECLKRNWNVLVPIGDRLPYDFVLEKDGKFLKIQVKSAYFSENCYRINTRRAKTNREKYKFEYYSINDFDFCIAFIEKDNSFHIIEIKDFLKNKSSITLSSDPKAKSSKFMNKWNKLINAE